MDKLELAVEKMAKITAKMKADKVDKDVVKEKHKKKNKTYTKDEQLAYLWEQYGIK